jgi:hypothetical protein
LAIKPSVHQIFTHKSDARGTGARSVAIMLEALHATEVIERAEQSGTDHR